MQAGVGSRWVVLRKDDCVNSSVYILGVLLQAFAGGIALLEVRHAFRKLPWLLIAISSLLIVVRRLATLEQFMKSGRELAAAEVLTLIISLLFFFGVVLMSRMFHEIRGTVRVARKSRELLDTVQRLAATGGWEWDVIHERMSWTDEVYRIHGLNPGDIPPGSPEHLERSLACYDPEDRPVIEAAFRRCVERGVPYSHEFPLTRADGRRIWISTMGLPITDDGKIVAVYGHIMDITERKAAEEALRISEERMSSAFTYAAIGMAFVGTDGRWLRINPAVSQFLGYAEDELLSKTFQDITHPDDLEKDLEFVRNMLAGEIATYQMEKRYIHKAGRIVWALLSVSLVRDQKGYPLHFISQIQDITQRKRAEEALRSASHYTRNLIETSLDPLVTINADGKITDVNEATENVTGVNRTGLVGSDFADYFTEPELARKGYQKAFTEGSVVDYPLVIRHTSGARTDVLYNASVYRNEYGEVSGVFAAARDITEQKRVERALRETVEQLRLALDQIKTLRGIVPICMGCKKVRDDKGFWQQVEVFVRDHSEAEFSHSLCPECLQKAYDELES